MKKTGGKIAKNVSFIENNLLCYDEVTFIFVLFPFLRLISVVAMKSLYKGEKIFNHTTNSKCQINFKRRNKDKEEGIIVDLINFAVQDSCSSRCLQEVIL